MWTHPLPPPDSGASFSSFGCFVFEFWVLRFRVLGASFSRFGCFVFEIWVLRASVFVFKCFVFETTTWHDVTLNITFTRAPASCKSDLLATFALTSHFFD